MKLLILDLDGTIRKPKPGKGFIDKPDDQEPIDRAFPAIKRYQKNGWEIYGCTNQGGVVAGFKSLEDCLDEQYKTLTLFPQMKAVYLCPDKGSTCWRVDAWNRQKYGRSKYSYRKPGIGMLKAIVEDFQENGGEKPEKILMVGDMETDKQAAIAANIGFMWADRWRNTNL